MSKKPLKQRSAFSQSSGSAAGPLNAVSRGWEYRLEYLRVPDPSTDRGSETKYAEEIINQLCENGYEHVQLLPMGNGWVLGVFRQWYAT